MNRTTKVAAAPLFLIQKLVCEGLYLNERVLEFNKGLRWRFFFLFR
ncbi:hypothetical protein [Neobacillus rhizophilus]|uniref:Uncharacterized protein n=1 Tax=Neobacillus rhizophilus TaxID=2833579 RepID=A0A942U841_9BACI|nr:hypothetical protein [Neobacillus rhizophilus]MBS4214151.1 hypothetical protein [Neobacillus rhizophilus]